MTVSLAKTPKTAPAPKAAKAAAKPSIEVYGFRSDWSGPSDLVNKNISRTKIDASRFGMYPKGNVTQRDTDAMVELREQFGAKAFERRNCDAGILRRLMERGLAKPMDLLNVDAPTAMFSLTKAGQGK